ncbi:MAG TPA: hypothetical protein VFQ13_04865 [Anaerolineales bacterium]|nr:hypothetical protein [Anaerolineales bacterium]
MKKKMQSTNRSQQKNSKRETNSSSKMRFFYIVMLLLTIFSLFLRVSGVGRAARTQASAGTAARVLVFHHKDASLCEDLTITATGNVVFSNCGSGVEKQYVLSSMERTELKGWIEKYSAVNYDHNDNTQSSVLTDQLYLNGQGKQQADNVETQQMIGFATTLAAKIASQP